MNNNMHPLDSLSVDEIKKSVNIFKSDNNSDENSVFSYISLEEPDKNFVKNYKVGDTFSRKTKKEPDSQLIHTESERHLLL